uniref:Sas10 C-terminal domain-containing protein n=1 Tax=Rhodosorus marinus TaxID=101924 RepID=A0A7S2ZD17_9RHOD|mmetsp:Transcript_1287/g.3796  ORF Transcript_1287/g.3796 Transcript_1287/m.3796 type:complete len:348 (+) Transcript_1287:139-1182(+)
MGGRRSRGKRRAPVEPSVEVGDEIDEFVSRREEVRLGGRDLDEEQSEEEVDETPVMGLEGEDGSEEDDDDDDDEGEDEAWKKKKLYYGGDNVDYNLMSSDEEDALEEEEQEALRLQSREAEELEEEDFAGQDVGEHTEESAAKLDKRQDDKDNIHEQATVMESVRKALGTVSDDEDEDESNANENSLEIFKREGIQKSAKSTLSQAEKLRIVEEKSPELIGLLVELKQSAQELRSLSEKTDKLSQPEALFQHALINYCVNILFYLRLKAEGGDVRSHPVIGQLLEMNRQISRLKKIAELNPELVEAVSSDEESPSNAQDDEEKVGSGFSHFSCKGIELDSGVLEPSR